MPKKKSLRFPKMIGVIHLRPLPGAPGAAKLHPSQALMEAGRQAAQEAVALQKAGFEAVVLENFGDTPFFKSHVPRETLASMAVITAAVREAVRIPIGINVLRNDAHSAMAVATLMGGDFIRVNVLSGVAASDQGILEGRAAQLLRYRERLTSDVRIFADVHVKHARSLSEENLDLAIEETVLRAGADGVILTGSTTGRAVSESDFEVARPLCRKLKVPLFVGSGVTDQTIRSTLKSASGVLVGSYIRKGGRAGNALDPTRIKKLVRAAKGK